MTVVSESAGGRSSGTAWWTLVAASVLTAACALWWRTEVFRAKRVELHGDAWDQLKQEYPIPQEAGSRPPLSADVLDGVVRANPFSPERRLKPPASGGAAEGGSQTQPGEPAAPKFAYKGQINLGKHQRAILEDITSHKTFFLEVGQEVAGFKVLDIGENQVLLSDLKTNEQLTVSLTSAASP